MKNLKVSELKPGFHIFGNHGAVWNKKCHIAKDGFDPDTLCGTPMLSSNWAKIENIQVIGCKECLKEYSKLLNQEKK